MLLYPSINELTKKADSKYTLAMLAAKRARDIIDNKPVLTEHVQERPVSTATYEIAEDLITYKRIEDSQEEAQDDAIEAEAADITDDVDAEAEAEEDEDEAQADQDADDEEASSDDDGEEDDSELL